jgi:phage-related baseplate assembly protein
MIFSVDQLLTPLTIAEARDTTYAILVQLGVPTTGWRAGAVVRFVVALVAILMVALSRIIVTIGKSGLLEHAEADWLTLHSKDTYGVERIGETFATGTVTLENTAGGVYNPDADEIIIQYAETKKTYRLVAFSLGAGTEISPTRTDVAVVAVEAGTASNVPPNAAFTFVTPLSGVTVSESTAIIGNDAETDDALRTRDGESLDALSPNGPAGAYLAVAKLAKRADGTNVGVTRAKVSAPSSSGEVTVTVASASGAISDIGSPSDLDCVNDAIQGVDRIGGCVPHGVTATVVSAVAHPMTITVDLYVYTTDGRTVADLETAAEAILSAWVPTRDIGGDKGGKVYLSAIRAKAMSVSPHCYQGVVTLPLADETIAANEVPTVGSVIVTAHLESP